MSAQQGQAAAAASLPPKTVPTGQPSGGASSDLADLNSVASTQGTLHAAIPLRLRTRNRTASCPLAMRSVRRYSRRRRQRRLRNSICTTLGSPCLEARLHRNHTRRQPHRRCNRPASSPPHADAAASCAEGCRSFTTRIVCDPPAADLGPHADPLREHCRQPQSTANPPDQVSAHALLNTPTSPPKQAE